MLLVTGEMDYMGRLFFPEYRGQIIPVSHITGIVFKKFTFRMF
jgi:hypothetical protein